jgi:hypothetical protein
MADSVMSYVIVAGIFVFLAVVLFDARARLCSHDYGKVDTESSTNAEAA